MFENIKGMTDQMGLMQQLMKDENFRAFIAHPKVQEIFKDPEFKEVAKTKDFAKILAHPKFVELMRDPELSQLMAKLNPQSFMGR